jgi:cell division protein ZapA
MSATVAVTVAGRLYEMACDDGQEQILAALGREVDKRAQDLLTAVGPVADTRLLLMVALTLVDDLNDARHHGTNAAPALEDEVDAAMAAGLEKLATRIESIADRLQKA